MDQLLASLNTQMTLTSMSKRQEVLNRLTPTGNQYLDTFIQLFLISFSSIAVGNIITYFKNFDFYQLKIFILLRYFFPLRLNRIEYEGEELIHYTSQKKWDMSDIGSALLWHIDKNIKKYKGIISLKELSDNDTNQWSVFGGLSGGNKKQFKEVRYRINQEKDINNQLDLHIKDNIYININYHTKDNKNYCKIVVFSKTKTVWQIQNLCNSIYKEYIEHINTTKLEKQHIFIYLGKDDKGVKQWRTALFNTNKTWNTLFIENKENIKKNIEQMINGKEYFKRIGKPNHTTIIADGDPGCGKNSLFKVLMKQSYPDRHLIIIPPDTIKKFSDWEDIVYDNMIMEHFIPTNKRVYQIDEIEKAFPILVKQDDISENDAMKEFLKNNKNNSAKSKSLSTKSMSNLSTRSKKSSTSSKSTNNSSTNNSSTNNSSTNNSSTKDTTTKDTSAKDTGAKDTGAKDTGTDKLRDEILKNQNPKTKEQSKKEESDKGQIERSLDFDYDSDSEVDILEELSQSDKIKSMEFAVFYNDFKINSSKDRMRKLSQWLGYFDGAFEQDGRVIFITTNDYESLDPVFVRPGRIDLRVTLCPATNQLAKSLISYIFNYDNTSQELNNMFDMIEDYQFTQSYLYQACLNNLLDIGQYDNNHDYVKNTLKHILGLNL